MKALTFAAIAALALAASGCYEATIHLNAPQVAVPSPQVDDEMHLSLIGLIEVSEAVNLGTACPGPPVSIEERVSVVGGIINLLLGTFIPVLQVMNPTVTCALPTSMAEGNQ